jgi:phosphatidylserine/phosphatidylglycerophosphate/cardiolipin synthase-like enzyme
MRTRSRRHACPSTTRQPANRCCSRAPNTNIPHNKFIVRLEDNETPVEVWTGSTNFTPSGFLGQTNVGHRVQDAETAKQYLDYWELLKTDPDRDQARAGAVKLTPDPPR